MNIKEQDEFKLVRILNKYFDDCLLEHLSECANEIIQAGFVQLRADSDRVVSKAVSEALSANNAKWREEMGFIESNLKTIQDVLGSNDKDVSLELNMVRNLRTRIAYIKSRMEEE